MNARILGIVGLSLLPCYPAMSLSTDRSKPLTVNADKVEIDDQSGNSIYCGKVIVIQGTLRITGDKLTVTVDEKRKIKTIVAEGKPATPKKLQKPDWCFYPADKTRKPIVAKGEPSTYKQRPDNKKEDVVGEAWHMEFQAVKDLLIMTDKAQITHAGNKFQSARILYHVKQDLVDAGSASSQDGRVNIIINPSVK